MQTLALTFVAFLLVASLRCWLQTIRRYRTGAPLLEWEPRARVPWTVWEVLAAVSVFLFVQLAIATGVRQWLGPELDFSVVQMTSDQWVGVLLADSLAKLAAAAIWLLLIRRAVKASWHDIGIQPNKWLQDLWLGAAVFVMLAPPVYLLQALLAHWMPYEHPLIEMLQERPEPVFLLVSGFAALVVAPVVEEFFFRTLLQGWLERLNTQRLTTLLNPLSRSVMPADSPADERSPADEHLSHEDVTSAEPGDQPDSASVDQAAGAATWPIFVTALLFALMHAPHGVPALVTLTLYAIGIGYVYRQTHRLVPCIVAHLALNAVSLLALALAILEG